MVENVILRILSHCYEKSTVPLIMLQLSKAATEKTKLRFTAEKKETVSEELTQFIPVVLNLRGEPPGGGVDFPGGRESSAKVVNISLAQNIYSQFNIFII